MLASISTVQEGGIDDVGSTPEAGGTDDDATADSAPDIETPSDATGADMDGVSDVGTIIDAAPDFGTTDAGAVGPILYPIGFTHSPITTSVATRLRSIAASVPTRDTHSFLKAGDPIMGNAVGSPNQVLQGDFFGCVESPQPMKDLAAYASLQATIDYFHEGNVGGKSPFAHVSRCTRDNLTSWDLLNLHLLPPEIADTNPSLAFVMFGSLDILNTGTFDPSPRGDWVKFRDHAQAMLDIEDTLIAAGVVPVLLSMPPRYWMGAPVLQTSTFVALTRAIAQGRQTPFVDFNLPMEKLPGKGLEVDGLHITQYDIGITTANCVFSDEGLKHGYNLLNLLGLQALERVKTILADGAAALDASAPVLEGEGTPAAPFEVPSLPFSDLRDLTKASSRALETYAGCGNIKEEGGEYVYRWNAAAPTRVRAVVIDRKGSSVAAHVYHLAGAPTASSCVASQSSNPSNGGLSAGTLAAGTHYFVVDSTAVAGSAAEYMFVLIECDNADTTCN